MLTTTLRQLWITTQTRIDALWGYDVFIAHRRSDAAPYAKSLFDALTQDHIASFIDLVVYGPGDSLLISTRRHASKSTVLVVLGSPDLLAVREPVDWVHQEIDAYFDSHDNPRVVVVTFGEPVLAALESQPLVTEPNPVLKWLRPFLRLSKPLCALTQLPTSDVLEAIERQLKGRRRDQSRLRFFQGVAALLFALMTLSVAFYFSESKQRSLAEHRLVLANSQVTAADARLLAVSELNASLRQSASAYRLAPSDDARSALLEGFDRAAQIVGFFPCEAGWKAGGVAFAPGPAFTLAFSCLKDRSSMLTVLSHDRTLTRWPKIDGEVRTLAFAGEQALAIDGTPQLRIIDPSTRQMAAFEAGKLPLFLVAPGADSDSLISAQQGNQVRVWTHHPNDHPTWSAGDPYTATYAIADVAYHRALNGVVAHSYNGSSYLLPLAQIAAERELEPPAKEPCESLYPKVTRVGWRVASQSQDGSVRAYLTDDNHVVVSRAGRDRCQVLQGNTHNAQVAVSDDGRRVATLGAYLSSDSVHGLILWDLEQLHPLARTVLTEPDSHHFLDIVKMAITPDGAQWAASDRYGAAVWNDTSVDLRSQVPDAYLTALALAPDGRELAAGFSTGQVARFRAGASAVIASLGSYSMDVLWYVDADLYAVDRSYRAWKVTGETPSVLSLDANADAPCQFVSQSGRVIALERQSPHNGATLQVIDLSKGTGPIFAVPADAGHCGSFVFSAQARLGVRIPQEYIDMTIVQLADSPPFKQFPNPLADISGLRKVLKYPQLSTDGTLMAAVASEDQLALFDVSTARLLGTLVAPRTQAVALSGNGYTLMSYNQGIGIVRWNLNPADWASRAEAMAGHDPRSQ